MNNPASQTMFTELLLNSPLASQITPEILIEQFNQAKGWQNRQKLLLKLAKLNPEFPSLLKTEQYLISGCESQVWLISQTINHKLYIMADSDARTVRGLLVILLSALNGKVLSEIQDFDLNAYLRALSLDQFISASRSHGLTLITEHIKQQAK